MYLLIRLLMYLLMLLLDIIPEKQSRKLRHPVENCFLVLKRWRGIATRYAKTSDAFIAAVPIRCIAIWTAIRA